MIVVFFKRPISQWSFKGKNGDTVTYKNVIESNNDLVRILAVSETHERNEEWSQIKEKEYTRVYGQSFGLIVDIPS